VEKFIQIGTINKKKKITILSQSKWFGNHVFKCKPIMTKEQTKNLNLPQCYVLIDYLDMPEETEFKYVLDSTVDLMKKLNIDDSVDDDWKSDEERTKVSEDNEDTVAWKDKEIRRNLDGMMKNKIF
jgi:hypothetical protein